MRSEFAEWLDQMQHVADKDNLIVQARHFDCLDYYFKVGKTPQQAFTEYKNNFLPRWNALTNNGRNTEATT